MINLDKCGSYFSAIRNTSDEVELLQNLRGLFSNYKVLSFNMGRGSVFWRGRRAVSGCFEHIREMSCPPASLTGAGRLNDPGAPCLYAATRRSTVLSELGAKAGESFQFVGFRMRPDRAVRIGAIGEFFHIHKTGYLKALGVDPKNGISRLLNSIGFDEGKLLIYIDAFLASMLADPRARESNYMCTRTIAKLALEQSKADGFFYPSVQDFNGMNLMITSAAYESEVNVVCCQLVTVTKAREFGVYDYEVVQDATGVATNGSISWKKPMARNAVALFGLTDEEIAFVRAHPQPNGNAYLDLAKFRGVDG